MGSSETPRNLVEHAADAGLKAIKEHLAHADAEIEEAIILLHINGAPTGEQDSVSAGEGVEDAKDLVAFLAGHFIGAARQVGLRVDLIAMDKPPPQG
jgi:hypothetical protein